MHQLTSEILHGVLTNHFGITKSMWQTKNILSSLLSSRDFLTDLKVTSCLMSAIYTISCLNKYENEHGTYALTIFCVLCILYVQYNAMHKYVCTVHRKITITHLVLILCSNHPQVNFWRTYVQKCQNLKCNVIFCRLLLNLRCRKSSTWNGQTFRWKRFSWRCANTGVQRETE